MVKTIDITIFSDGLSNKNVIDAGVQGDDNTTALNVTVDSGALPTVADGETLKIFAECVNGAGEYYVSDFLEFNDNTIYFPLPIEITRGGGMASLHFVFSVLSVSNEQLRASVTSEIKLRFEDSAQFYQSEYLDAMSSVLANLYKYRGKFDDLQSQIDTIDDVKVPELHTDIEMLKSDTTDHIGRLVDADENLQSQIDALGGADLSELQTDINHLQEKVNVMNGDIGDWIGSDTVYQAVTKLQNKDKDLQSQIDSKSNATNFLNGSATGSLRCVNTKAESSDYKMGNNAVAEGNETTASGSASHAEGYRTVASGTGSHAEGRNTNAVGDYSHAEGYAYSETIYLTGDADSTTYTVSVANSEIRVGRVLKYDSNCVKITAYDSTSLTVTTSSTLSSSVLNSASVTLYRGVASGSNSHTEGYYTTASAESAHAEGYHTFAHGNVTHSEGWYTIAGGAYQHVQGKYNVEDTSDTYAHIVGNGNSSARSNAHTLDWSGNAWFAGDVYIGGTSQNDANAISLLSIIADLTARIEALENSAS